MQISNTTITLLTALCFSAVLAGSACAQRQTGHHFSGGVHYWRTVGDITQEGFDRENVSWRLYYQYALRLLKMDIGTEIFPRGYYGSRKTTIAPQAFIGVATPIYASLGISTACAGDIGRTFAAPFYILRAGLDFEFLPEIYLDFNANYYFTDWDTLNNINTDTITLGVQARFAF